MPVLYCLGFDCFDVNLCLIVKLCYLWGFEFALNVAFANLTSYNVLLMNKVVN